MEHQTNDIGMRNIYNVYIPMTLLCECPSFLLRLFRRIFKSHKSRNENVT